jgi:hypothetical protein
MHCRDAAPGWRYCGRTNSLARCGPGTARRSEPYLLREIAETPALDEPSVEHPFTVIDGTVKVIECLHFDTSPTIGFGELVVMTAAWNSVGPPNQSPNWDPRADFDQNDAVGFTDHVILTAYWNKVCPA